MTKTNAISALIIAKMAEGLNAREALDAICGAGTSDRLVHDLYYKLRGEPVPPFEPAN